MQPGPYAPHSSPAPRPLFRDSRPLVRTTALVWVLAALGTLVVGFVEAGRQADLLERYRAGDLAASELDDSFNFGFVLGGSSLLTAALSIGGLVLVIVATFRLAKNHQAFGRPGTRFGPGWAIAGWLIPLANAVIPYLLVRDLWRGSDPELGLDAYDWSTRRSHRAIWVAFALSLASIVLGIVLVVWVMSSTFGSLDVLRDSDRFRVDLAEAAADARPLQYLASVLVLVSTCVMAWVLVQLAERQQALAERLQLVDRDGRPQFVPPAFAPAYQPYPVAFPPGWFADPWHRFQLRWWDGAQWSAHVSSDGIAAYDPLHGIPPAPPG